MASSSHETATTCIGFSSSNVQRFYLRYTICYLCSLAISPHLRTHTYILGHSPPITATLAIPRRHPQVDTPKLFTTTQRISHVFKVLYTRFYAFSHVSFPRFGFTTRCSDHVVATAAAALYVHILHSQSPPIYLQPQLSFNLDFWIPTFCRSL
jgi:hypothetical protein